MANLESFDPIPNQGIGGHFLGLNTQVNKSQITPDILKRLSGRIEVRPSPDGRINMYYDKATGRMMSGIELNQFLQNWQNQTRNKIALGFSLPGSSEQDFPFTPQEVEQIKQQGGQARDIALGMSGAGIGTRVKSLAQEAAPLLENAAGKLAPVVKDIPAFGVQYSAAQRTALSLLKNKPEVYKQIMQKLSSGAPQAEVEAFAKANQIFPSEISYLKQALQQNLAPMFQKFETAAQKAANMSLPGLPAALEGAGTASKIPYGAQISDAAANLYRQGASKLQSAVAPIAEKAGAAMRQLPGAAMAANPQQKLMAARLAANAMTSGGATPSAAPNQTNWLVPPTARNLQPVAAGAAGKKPDQFAGMPYGQSAEDSYDQVGQTMAPTGQPGATVAQAPGAAAAQRAARFPSRAGSLLQSESARVRTATSGPEAAGAPTQGAATDKVPVTTSGKPDYNYYAEMMNAADRNDAYARDLINLKEQARMAAIDAASRGEKFRFVPVKDYMNNRIIFVNAGGNDVVLDMNDPYQGAEYQKLLDKAGIDPTTMTDWMHRSSKPMLRYMQPAGGARDVTPDFGFTRRSVEMGEGGTMSDADKYKLPDIAHVGSTEMPKFGQTRDMNLEPEAEMPTPTVTPPSDRPEPQPTSVAAVVPKTKEEEYMETAKRAQKQRKAMGMTSTQARRIDQSKKWL